MIHELSTNRKTVPTEKSVEDAKGDRGPVDWLPVGLLGPDPFVWLPLVAKGNRTGTPAHKDHAFDARSDSIDPMPVGRLLPDAGSGQEASKNHSHTPVSMVPSARQEESIHSRDLAPFPRPKDAANRDL